MAHFNQRFHLGGFFLLLQHTDRDLETPGWWRSALTLLFTHLRMCTMTGTCVCVCVRILYPCYIRIAQETECAVCIKLRAALVFSLRHKHLETIINVYVSTLSYVVKNNCQSSLFQMCECQSDSQLYSCSAAEVWCSWATVGGQDPWCRACPDSVLFCPLSLTRRTFCHRSPQAYHPETIYKIKVNSLPDAGW